MEVTEAIVRCIEIERLLEHVAIRDRELRRPLLREWMRLMNAFNLEPLDLDLYIQQNKR